MLLYRGKLIRWDDERGFGFIENNIEKNGIFIHISALRTMSRRPIINDIIEYEILIENKKIQAINAIIEVVKPIKKSPQVTLKTEIQVLTWHRAKSLLIIVCIVFGMRVVYKLFSKPNTQESVSQSVVSTPPSETLLPPQTTTTYTCDGRTHCSQMGTKEEAIYFITHCPNTKMDGDGDGEPCEDQFGKN